MTAGRFPPSLAAQVTHYANSSNSAFASFRSRVSNPSVIFPQSARIRIHIADAILGWQLLRFDLGISAYQKLLLKSGRSVKAYLPKPADRPPADQRREPVHGTLI